MPGLVGKAGRCSMIDLNGIKITTLCDNGVADIQYIAEWGLSMHLDTGEGRSILFDTGRSGVFLQNALTAGIDLSAIDCVGLSHGHSDHTGGLRSFLVMMQKLVPQWSGIDIYCHPDALEDQYVNHGQDYFYRGIPYNLEELFSLGARFKTSGEPVWLHDDIVLSGEVPLVTDFESPSSICYKKSGDDYLPSPVLDDQALFIRTNQGLVVMSGCAHRGIINTLLHARQVTRTDKICLVLGGTHLLNTSARQQERTADMLLDLQVSKVGVSHCTGHKPACYLASRLGMDRFFFNNAGSIIGFADNGLVLNNFEK
jgi:7,8-dihydropterin-6-yl-methyl-4-(beta-D-ribofuranosyl)aminobenzene 5'-phosphate synthase